MFKSLGVFVSCEFGPNIWEVIGECVLTEKTGLLLIAINGLLPFSGSGSRRNGWYLFYSSFIELKNSLLFYWVDSGRDLISWPFLVEGLDSIVVWAWFLLNYAGIELYDYISSSSSSNEFIIAFYLSLCVFGGLWNEFWGR